MTPVRTFGTLRGSRMESVIGMIYGEKTWSGILCGRDGEEPLTKHIPSKEYVAVLERPQLSARKPLPQKSEPYPINSGKSTGLNSFTSAIPCVAIIPISLQNTYTRPPTINPSAMSARELSRARLRTRTMGT
jgi:hypothetical protein